MAQTNDIRTIPFGTFDWEWDEEDKDATFKQEVALYSLEDPTPTIKTMSRNLSIPVGAIVRYVLAKWAASGSAALLEIGPRVVQQMADILDEAERSGDDRARLEAYRKLSGMVSWLNVPLTDPDWRPGSCRDD
jgi:hypothetical protein